MKIRPLYHVAKGCRSEAVFHDVDQRNLALCKSLSQHVEESRRTGDPLAGGDNEYPYGVDFIGNRAHMFHLDVDEEGTINVPLYIAMATWVPGEDNPDDGIWYQDIHTWDQAMWWHEPPATGILP